MPPKSTKKKQQTTNYEESQRLMTELVNLMQAEEGETEDEAEDESEDKIHKELVTWAGRLEMESIDLRDKSKLLIAELSKNSDLLKHTSTSIQQDLEAWKKETKLDIKGVLEKVTKAQTLLQRATIAIESRKRSQEKELQPIVIDPKISSSLESISKQMSHMIDEQIPNLAKKEPQRQSQTDMNIKKILLLVKQASTEQSKKVPEGPILTSIRSLSSNFRNCMMKLTEISKNQDKLTKELLDMKKNQNELKDRFRVINRTIENKPRESYPTPYSSFDQHHKPYITTNKEVTSQASIHCSFNTSKRKSPKRADSTSTRISKHPRKLLQTQVNEEYIYGDTTLVSLLSDDLHSDL